MPSPDAGRGKLRLAPNARIVVLRECTQCKKLGPECRCGHPKLYEGR